MAMTSGNTVSMPRNGLSKSKKKRNKRNEAKARRQAEVEKQVASDVIVDKSLNPYDKLRANLVALGLQLKDIDQALEEMWNLQLQYDEVDAVLNFIHEKDTVKARAVTSTSDQVSSVTKESIVAVINPLSTNIQQDPTPSIENCVDSVCYKDGMEEISDLALSQGASASLRKIIPEAHDDRVIKTVSNINSLSVSRPLSMTSKLDLVANHDDLSDSVVALTEWVVKAAKFSKVKELCAGRTTKAFPIVIRRSIIEPTNVIGQIIGLIISILRISGVPSSSLALLARALDVLLSQARSAVSSDESIRENISEAVVETVVSNTAKMVGYCNSFTEEEMLSIRCLEEEIDKITSSEISNLGVVELMSRRECSKDAAEKYSSVIDTMLHTTFTINKQTVNVEETMDESNILRLILGHRYDDTVSSRAQYNSIKSQLNEMNSTCSAQKESLTSTVTSCKFDRNNIAKRIEKLQTQMDRLNIEDGMLEEKIRGAEEKLALLEDSLTDEVRDLEAKLNDKCQLLKLDNVAVNMMGTLNKFEETLRKITVDYSHHFNESSNANIYILIPDKMDIYLSCMKNYFQAETEMFEFLNKRALSMEEELPSLKREVDECTALGMTTNVSELTKTLNKTYQDVADDYAACKALKDEAKEMQCNFMERLKQYLMLPCANDSGSAIVTLDKTALKGIIDAMKKIGLCEGLSSSILNCLHLSDEYVYDHINANNINKETHSLAINNDEYVSAPPILGYKTTTKNHIGEPLLEGKKSLNVAVHIGAQRKFGWRNIDAPKKGPKKSLIDIQKEEMSLKAQCR